GDNQEEKDFLGLKTVSDSNDPKGQETHNIEIQDDTNNKEITTIFESIESKKNYNNSSDHSISHKQMENKNEMSIFPTQSELDLIIKSFFFKHSSRYIWIDLKCSTVIIIFNIFLYLLGYLV
ncbi:MAG: hypothetical protein MHMPM18_003625, partial [Marteilia pararefringens]